MSRRTAAPPSGRAIVRAGAGPADPCPCGSDLAFGACCEPYLDGELAPSPEALMRSRYTAYALGDEDYIFRTWSPRTRPPGPYCHPGTRWLALTILAATTAEQAARDGRGLVEFRAEYETHDGRGGVSRDVLHERSRFVRRGQRWLYLDGAFA